MTMNSNPGNVDSALASGGSSRPPTQFDTVTQSPKVEAGEGAAFALQESAEITTSALTNVLNIAGSGVVTYLSASAVSGALSNAKIRITVDGVIALDFSGAVGSTESVKILGVADDRAGSSGLSLAEVLAPFNASFVVEIAGDGVDPLKFFHKKYLT